MDTNPRQDNVALVTGADRGLGLAMCAGLAQRGWRVFAGQYLVDWFELDALVAQYPEQVIPVPLDVSSIKSAYAAAEYVQDKTDRLDMLISNAAMLTDATMRRPISEPQEYGDLQRMYDVNSLGPLRTVEAFLPLVAASSIRRLCFVSSEAGSISRAYRTAWFGYMMSKAALNMAVKIMFNDLHPQGYSFRLYHPGYVRGYMHGHKNMEADMEPEEAAVPTLAYFLSGIDPAAPGEPAVDEDHLVMRDYLGEDWPW
jgi:NAD(P)-dependent dehydrogenase (short-subunit alcohol dehydrogenase family)